MTKKLLVAAIPPGGALVFLLWPLGDRRWDGVISPGTRVDSPVVQTDIFATTAAAARVALPTDRVYDGVDLLPFASGEGDEAPHEVLRWKTMYGHVIHRDRWKLILDDHLSTVRLYDLQADPGERIDLSRIRPRILRELTQEVPPPL